MDKDKKHRIKTLEKEYLKLSKKKLVLLDSNKTI